MQTDKQAVGAKGRPTVKFKWDDGADATLGLPAYETKGAAGADIRANFTAGDRSTPTTLAPMERKLVPTGLRVEIPAGYEMQIRPRSGLAFKHGVTLVNTPGTIDSDYRGPVGILMINHGTDTFTINHGERIAQIIIAPVVQADFSVVENLDETARGEGGFGSTGRH